MNIKNFLKKILSFFDIYLFKSNNKKVERILKKIKILDTGYDLIKIGEINNDGSYLVPDALNDIKYCFSPGVGESTLFEDSLKKKNIQSFLADGTISENQIKKINHDYINKNINVFNDENNITMKDWIDLKIKNKDRQNNLLLQMDIEGSEYEVLLNIENSTLEKFKIMVIEFHDFYNLGCAPGADLFYNILNKKVTTGEKLHSKFKKYENYRKDVCFIHK